jgi:pseudouridine-5'-phosphate glycosidase
MPYPYILKSLVKADDGNLLDKNMHTVTENTANSLFSRKEVDLELQGLYV